TNDGDLNNYIRSKGNQVIKVYELIIQQDSSLNEKIHLLLNGVELNDGPAKALKIIKGENNEQVIWDKKFSCNKIFMFINEGRNRMIRKMCKKVKFKLLKLHRLQVGNIQLGDLKENEYR